MKNLVRVAAFAICTALAAPVGAQSNQDGMRAYRAGDYSAALEIFRPLAQSGDAIAQSSLGLMYFHGRGVPQNYSEAMRWYRLAAAQGNALAQQRLERLETLIEDTAVAAPVNVPENASPNTLGGWMCNLGYRRVGDACEQMSEEERLAQLLRIAAMLAEARNRDIEGYDFSLADIERRCEARVRNRTNGELNCRGMRELERRCDVRINDWPNGEIDCRGSSFRIVERRCTVYMRSGTRGDIECR